ncbi:MAG: CHAP domain-containing protein [Verrucomicrobiaceae bacterium]|nr:MAG: CHAP domain-containing protein [Verrucomicrobiaceae bacterium]
MKSLIPFVFSLACVSWLPSCTPSAVVSVPTSGRTTGSNRDLVEYCRVNDGRKVGDGQCWSLANEAFKATGKTRPGGSIRVWGSEVNYKSAGVQPGDILEFESATFVDGGRRFTTGPNHTAVVTSGGTGMITVAEQNFMGKKKVVHRQMQLRSPDSGKLRVYRPQ